MSYKIYLKGLLIFLGIIVGLSFINTIFYYKDFFTNNIINISEIISLIIATLATGLYIGLNSKNKGYINGLILGLIITILSVFLNVILKQKITIVIIATYLLLIILAVGSSILGINHKK